MSERSPRIKITYAAVAAFVLLLTYGCTSTHRAAPVTERLPPGVQPAPQPPSKVAVRQPDPRPEFYTVKKGDTLYSIALDHGLDYKELAEWNNLGSPNVIRIGQRLQLVSTVVVVPFRTAPAIEGKSVTGSALPNAAAVSGSDSNFKSQPKAVKVPYSDQALAQLSGQPQAKATSPAVTAKVEPRPEEKPAGSEDDDEKIAWGWPVGGKLLSTYNETTNLKGIGISGKLGQPVIASAPGKVLYSGDGIRGYGKLVIIKHNKVYLTVYAHNSQLLVKEGQNVVKGQKIAEMGNSDTDQIKLHFEIRRFGRPVDPIKLLPSEQPA